MQRSEIRGRPVRAAIPGFRLRAIRATDGFSPSFRDAQSASPASITTNLDVARCWGRYAVDNRHRWLSIPGSRWRAPRNDEGNLHDGPTAHCRHRPRKRATQYSEPSVIKPKGRGVLDPHVRGDDSSSFRGARSARPESITTVADFENHWIHIAPREVSWLWIPGLRQVGASRNDDGEACAKWRIPVWLFDRLNQHARHAPP